MGRTLGWQILIRVVALVVLAGSASALALAGVNGLGSSQSGSSTAPSYQLSNAKIVEIAQKTAVLRTYHVNAVGNFNFSMGNMTSLGASGTASGDVNVSGNQLELDFNGNVAGTNATGKVIVIGSDVYLQINAGIFSSNNRFYKFEIPGLTSDFSRVTEVVFDPAKVLEKLSKITVIQNKGITNVNGQSADLYQATIDISKLLNTKNSKEVHGAVNGTVTVSVWVSTSDNVIIKDSASMNLTANILPPNLIGCVNCPIIPESSSFSVNASGAITANFSNFGEPVNIAPPPASEITQFPDFNPTIMPAIVPNTSLPNSSSIPEAGCFTLTNGHVICAGHTTSTDQLKLGQKTK